MNKCENCICNPVCDHNKYGWENCNNYKDKSLFVEIKCKIGDTVYQTDVERIYELEVFDVSLRNYKPYYETESIDFDDDAIGKCIFLTKEEAERRLKEV